MALRYLRETAALDLDPDPNSAGGIRVAGLGGLWQAVVLGFGGVELAGERLRIEPRLPAQWRSLSFRVCWRGRRVSVRVAAGMVEVELASGEAMEVIIASVTQRLESGTKLEASL